MAGEPDGEKLDKDLSGMVLSAVLNDGTRDWIAKTFASLRDSEVKRNVYALLSSVVLRIQTLLAGFLPNIKIDGRMVRNALMRSDAMSDELVRICGILFESIASDGADNNDLKQFVSSDVFENDGLAFLHHIFMGGRTIARQVNIEESDCFSGLSFDQILSRLEVLKQRWQGIILVEISTLTPGEKIGISFRADPSVLA